MTVPQNKPEISVVIPFWNGESFLGDSLKSIRSQPNVAVELIVVDGKSTDRSRDIAAEFDARVIGEDAPGLATAWNTGLGYASAPLVAFLDSDDCWLPNTLAARIQQLQLFPEAGFSVGRVQHFIEPGASIAVAKRERLLREQLAPIPGTMLFRKAIFERVGLFDPRFAIAADADWVARSVSQNIQSCEFDGLVLMKRLHSANLTAQVELTQTELLALLRRKIGRDR